MSWDYQRALKTLDEKKRNRDSYKLEHNTYLLRHCDRITVRLHSTDVVTYYPDGRKELRTGGWETNITKDRIGSYGVPVYNQKVAGFHGWVICVGDIEYIFESGMKVDKDGNVTTQPLFGYVIEKITGKSCPTKEQIIPLVQTLDNEDLLKLFKKRHFRTEIVTWCRKEFLPLTLAYQDEYSSWPTIVETRLKEAQ